jgi:molybdopterin synthase catalytic subunit
VAIGVSSPHRKAALEAGEWLIDKLKETVPIWKQERYADGSTEWVHPGINR